MEKIISGGQTGVDRAALDFAIENGIPHGGWCPKGRRAEDGPLPLRYKLEETASAEYDARTRKNVEDSDGTLVIFRGELKGGTAYTAEYCQAIRKSHFLVDLDVLIDRKAVETWLVKNKIAVLNVAGPRESQSPGIYNLAKALLEDFQFV